MNGDIDEAPDTPKIHNKRRTVTLEAGGSVAEAAYSSSSETRSGGGAFDCQSLQRSLKRVRLTSSPGELRLQRDLRHAVLHHHWIPVAEDEWKICIAGEASRMTAAKHNDANEHEANFSITQGATVDAVAAAAAGAPAPLEVAISRVGSMELVLRMQITQRHPVQGASACTNSQHTVTVHLQFPLMYPHRPPLVRLPQHSDFNLVIAASPEEALSLEAMHKSTARAAPGTIAIVWTEWSPIHRLSDICAWLVETCVQHASCFSSSSSPASVVTDDYEHHATTVPQEPIRSRLVTADEEKKDDDDGNDGGFWKSFAPSLPVDDSNSYDHSSGGSSSFSDNNTAGNSSLVCLRPASFAGATNRQKLEQERDPSECCSMDIQSDDEDL